MIHRFATHAMGTRFELALDDAIDGGAPHPESHIRAVGEEAVREIEHWHQRLNYFSPDSDIARINRSAGDRAVRIDRDLFDLLDRCLQLSRASDGAFDITIAPLMRRHGFRPKRARADAAPCALHAAPPGFDRIDLDDDALTVRFTRPGMEIDLGGIAKGWALDRVRDLLRHYRITRALIHGGTSTAVAIGAPPDQPTWRIAIQPPDDRDGTDHRETDLRPVASLKDAALSVSAPHGRMIEREGRRIGHVIDPRSGAPADGAALAAVIASSATDADAWSTALIVLKRQPRGTRGSLSSLVALCEGDRLNWKKQGDHASLFELRLGPSKLNAEH